MACIGGGPFLRSLRIPLSLLRPPPLPEDEKAGSPSGLPASPYDYRERRGKMVCVAQAFRLTDSSYPRRREKSTAFHNPSQFVYNQTDFGIFYSQFV